MSITEPRRCHGHAIRRCRDPRHRRRVGHQRAPPVGHRWARRRSELGRDCIPDSHLDPTSRVGSICALSHNDQRCLARS